MNDSKSKGSGLKDSQGVSPRQPAATKVKHKNTEGNSKVFSSIDSAGRMEKNTITLPPIQGQRNLQAQGIHSMGGGSPPLNNRQGRESAEDEVVMAPVIDKGKKSEFEATGTSNIKSNLPVTNQADDQSNKDKKGEKDAEDENGEDQGDQDEAGDDGNWYEQPEVTDEPNQFRMHGKVHTFSIRSFFLFSNTNRFRRLVVWIITHKRFDHFIVFLILVNALLLGIKDYTDPENLTQRNQKLDMFEPIFTWSFLIEFLLKVIGMGFILDDGSYLRDAWNWLDFIVVVSSLLTEIPAMKSVSGIRTFRLLRPLRSLTTMPSMKILISTLLASVAQLGGVLVLALFFFTIFAILGISLWIGSIHRRCRLTQFPVDGDWVADDDLPTLCSAYNQCPTNRWCGSLKEAYRAYEAGNKKYFIDYSPECEENPDCENKVKNLQRDTEIEDLNFGYSSFDNIAVSFLTIFQCVTLEGWIDITNIYKDAYSPHFVNFYFLLCIVVCSFFVLNLTIAVMLIKYEELDKSEKSSEHLEDLRVYGNEIGEEGLPEAFTEFIIEQDNINISPKGIKILNSQVEDNSWRKLIKVTATFDPDDGYYHNAVTRWSFYLVNSPLFNAFILIVIIANTVVLSLDKFPDHDEFAQHIFKVLNVSFTIIFTFEVVVKIIGVGTRGFCADRFNIFDGVIVLISLVEMGMEQKSKISGTEEEGGSGGAISAMRALRLFRVFKLFKAGDLRTLLDGIAFTILAVGDYCILLSLFIYIFALLGMSIFAGKIKYNDDGEIDLENGEVPRANFDKVQWAMVSVFFVMIGENWNSLMYDHMRGTSWGVCLYFILLVMFGNIVMLNLFLAILLGNFDRARSFGEKKKIFDAFDSMNKMGYNLNISIAYLFDDQDLTKFIEDKVLCESKNDSPAKKQKEAQEQAEKFEFDHTEKEVRQLYCAMTMGNIEQILSGEKFLEDEPWEDFAINDIPDHQREKTIEILNYIKRQKNLRTQRLEFHDQLKKTQDQREALDKMAIEEEVISSESDASAEAQTFFEKVLDHLQNSSLLIFHQDNIIRQWCQMLVQSEDDDAGDQNKPQPMQTDLHASANDANMFSPSQTNKVGSMDDNQDTSKRRQAMNKTVTDKNNQQLQFLSGSNQKGQTQKLQPGMSMVNKSQTIKKTAKTEKITPVKVFEAIIMTLIIVSSVMLIVDNPYIDPESDGIVFVGYLDNCFTVLFTIEATIKIIAMGFLFTNSTLKEKKMEAYMRSPWNILDIIVVAASLMDFVVLIKASKTTAAPEGEEGGGALTSNLKSVKALRALRALRPLRMISRNQGMKLIVNALLASLPSIMNVTIVCMLFILIFGIVGVSFFKGGFGHCVLDDEDAMAKVTNELNCVENGGEWNNPVENFDNAKRGVFTLIEMLTTEGWIDVMNAGVDSVPPVDGIQQQPIEHNTDGYMFYFLLYMIFGSQFILNLFVGVIMDNFNKIKEKQEWGSLFVTDDQRAWIDAQRLGLGKNLQKKIDPPPGWRTVIFNLVNHKFFEALIMFFIIFNTVIMASNYEGIDTKILDKFQQLNYVFAGVFNVEMVLKMIGLGWQYFYSGWNVFDCIVVIGTNIGILLNLTTSGSSISTATTVVRAFRIMRIVRLIRSQENIKMILEAVVNIIPSITNFITLLFLMIFIFAALGMSLFGLTVHGEFITDKQNFEDIWTAIIFLLRCATGEDWNKVMHEYTVSVDSGRCIDDQDFHVLKNNKMVTQACGNSFSIIYFMCFLVLISWLILNLSVAAVIEGLENAKQENSGLVAGDDVMNLIEQWMEYDPKATGWISVLDFVCLIIELPPPFGDEELTSEWKKESRADFEAAKKKMYNKSSYYVNEQKRIIVKNKDILKILKSYKITTYESQNHKVHFKDIYQKLIKKVFLEEVENFEISKYLKTKMKNQWMEKHKKVKEMQKTGFKAHQGFASKIISDYAKRHRFQKENAKQGRKPSTEEHEQYANYKTMKNQVDIQKNSLSEEDLKKIKNGSKPDYKIGFTEDQRGTQQENQHRNNRGVYSNEIDLSPSPADGQRPAGQGRTRQKNKDENPQEFEEVGSQEEQSEERAIQYINQNQAQIARQDPGSERHQDSMASKEEDLQVRIKMGQSITDSQVNKSDSNMLLLSPKEEENEEGLIPSKSGNLEAQHRRAGSNMSQTQAHQRSRSHQNNVETNQRANLRDSGSSNQGYHNRGVDLDGKMSQPPKTANPGQGRPKRSSIPDINDADQIKDKNNFFNE